MNVSQRCSLLNRHRKKNIDNSNSFCFKSFRFEEEKKKDSKKGTEKIKNSRKSFNKTMNIQIGKSFWNTTKGATKKSRNTFSQMSSNNSPLVSLTNASFSIIENDKLKSKIDSLSNINNFMHFRSIEYPVSLKVSHEKISEIHNRIISNLQENRKTNLVLEEKKIHKVVSDESSSFYFCIQTKGKIGPLKMRFIDICPQFIILNLYSSYKSKYPCDKSFTDKILKIQSNKIYKLLNADNMKKEPINFDLLYIKIESNEKFKLKLLFSFGSNPLICSEKEKIYSPTSLLKRKIPKLKDVNQHIKYILNNKNELILLLKKAEIIQKKRQEQLSFRSTNNNIIKSNHNVNKSFYNFKKTRENEFMKSDLRTSKATEYRSKSMENSILNKILFSNRWNLRKIQQLKYSRITEGNEKVKNFKKAWIIIWNLYLPFWTVYQEHHKLKLIYVQNLNNLVKSSYIAHKYRKIIKTIYGDMKKMRILKIKLNLSMMYFECKEINFQRKIQVIIPILKCVSQNRYILNKFSGFIMKIEKIQLYRRSIQIIRQLQLQLISNYWDKCVSEIYNKSKGKAKKQISIVKKIMSIRTEEKNQKILKYLHETRDTHRLNFIKWCKFIKLNISKKIGIEKKKEESKAQKKRSLYKKAVSLSHRREPKKKETQNPLDALKNQNINDPQKPPRFFILPSKEQMKNLILESINLK